MHNTELTNHRLYIIQKISKTCLSCLTETCLGWCKKILAYRWKTNKSFAFFILRHYVSWYKKWLSYWSLCFSWFQTSIHDDTWLFTLTFYSVRLSWSYVGFQSVLRLSSLLSHSDSSFYNLVFTFWLITNIRSAFPFAL